MIPFKKRFFNSTKRGELPGLIVLSGLLKVSMSEMKKEIEGKIFDSDQFHHFRSKKGEEEMELDVLTFPLLLKILEDFLLMNAENVTIFLDQIRSFS